MGILDKFKDRDKFYVATIKSSERYWTGDYMLMERIRFTLNGDSDNRVFENVNRIGYYMRGRTVGKSPLKKGEEISVRKTIFNNYRYDGSI
jgi:hypothetical protein